MKKTAHSLPALREALSAANQRYLKFISSIATLQVGVEKLHKLAETKTENDHRFKGFNLFSEEDSCLFRTLMQGEFFVRGFTNKQLRISLSAQKNPALRKSASQITRLLKRLRAHGVIKKVGKRYKYYLTNFGRQTAAMVLKVREKVVIPTLAYAANSPA